MADDDKLHEAVSKTLIEICSTTPVIEALERIEQRYRASIEMLDVWLWDQQHLVLQSLRNTRDDLGRNDVDDALADHVVAPLEVLGEDIGLVSALPAGADSADDPGEILNLLSPLLAMAIRSNAPTLDTIPRRRRRREMALPAEIQWGLLPPTEFSAPPASLSAAVEPAYDTGGDVYDYALDEHTIFLGVLDAVGHGLRAAQLSMLAVSALRRERRNGGSLTEMASAVSAAVATCDTDEFVSGVLAQIDLRSWNVSWLSAGHLPPMLIDASGIEELDLAPTLPLGMEIQGETADPKVRTFTLEPGSTLVLYSDGIVENASEGDNQPVGEARFKQAIDAERAMNSVPTARGVIEQLLAITGPKLRDDATLLLVTRTETN